MAERRDVMFELHYTGAGYSTVSEIETDAKARGFAYSYWATEIGYNGSYNGDTVVVYTDIASLPENYREDAVVHGKRIG